MTFISSNNYSLNIRKSYRISSNNNNNNLHYSNNNYNSSSNSNSFLMLLRRYLQCNLDLIGKILVLLLIIFNNKIITEDLLVMDHNFRKIHRNPKDSRKVDPKIHEIQEIIIIINHNNKVTTPIFRNKYHAINVLTVVGLDIGRKIANPLVIVLTNHDQDKTMERRAKGQPKSFARTLPLRMANHQF